MTADNAGLPGGHMKHIILAVCLFFAVAASAQTDRTFLKSKLAAERHLPFSSAVRVADTLYIAGTTADPDRLAKGLSLEQEATDLMDQVKQNVEKAGMTMDDVVSVQVFCTDLGNYQAFNSVYSKYFHEDFPARTFVGIAKLLFGARFEVNAVAVARTPNVKK
jgi:2-iminobutanoate/2-iminopropanoate deaminase